MKRQTKVATNALVLWKAAILLMLFSAASLLAQTGRPASPPTPPPNPPEATGATESVVPRIDNLSRSTRNNPVARLPVPSLMMRSPTTLETLKENLDELHKIAAKLQQAIGPGASPDYQALMTNAALIDRLAKCVQSATGLRASVSRDSRSLQNKEAAADENLRQLVSAIDQAVNQFANSPVAQRSKTIDAAVMGEAGVALEKIITLSAVLKEQAEALSKSMEPGESLQRSVRSKHNYKRLPYLQLTVDCSIWTADLFSHQLATVKKDDALRLEGVEIQLNHHKLTERRLISLDECMPCSFDEKAVAEGERYAVLLTDFYSYEVKGRPFAYHVAYEVVRTKNDKIRSRLMQPVILFFIDAGGQGEFELAQSNRPLTPLPEWVKELAPNRWAAASKRD